MNIIRKTQSLSNLPSLTEAELGQRSLDWYEHLFGFIPIARLVEMFNLAVQSHSGRFAINAFDIVRVWNETVAVERTELKTVTDTEHLDCLRCDGSGVEMICNAQGDHLGSRPGCDHRPVIEGEGLMLYFQNQSEQIVARQMEFLLKESFREAIKICSKLITELIQAEAETEDDGERERIVAGKGQLLRVRRYLQEF